MDPEWNFPEPFPAQPRSPQGRLGSWPCRCQQGGPSRVRLRGPRRAPGGGFSMSCMLSVIEEGFSCL